MCLTEVHIEGGSE